MGAFLNSRAESSVAPIQILSCSLVNGFLRLSSGSRLSTLRDSWTRQRMMRPTASSLHCSSTSASAQRRRCRSRSTSSRLPGWLKTGYSYLADAFPKRIRLSSTSWRKNSFFVPRRMLISDFGSGTLKLQRSIRLRVVTNCWVCRRMSRSHSNHFSPSFIRRITIVSNGCSSGFRGKARDTRTSSGW